MTITVLFYECGFVKSKFFTVRILSDQPNANTCSCKITKLPHLVPIACRDLVFWIGEGELEGKLGNLMYTE